MRTDRRNSLGWFVLLGALWPGLAVLFALAARDCDRSDGVREPVVSIAVGTPLGFTPDGTRFAADFGGRRCQWDWSTGVLLDGDAPEGDSKFFRLHLPESRLLAATTDRGVVRICKESETEGAAVAVLAPPQGMWAYHMAASPDGRWFAVLFVEHSADDAVVAYVDPNDFPDDSFALALFATNDWATEQSLLRFKGRTPTIEFSPDGRWLALGGYEVDEGKRVERIALFDTARGTKVRMIRPDPIEPVGEPHLSFSPDGTHLASGTTYFLNDQNGYEWSWHIRVWNATTGELEWSTSRERRRLWSMEYSPRGEFLAIADISDDFTLSEWDPGDGTFVDTRPQGPRCLVWGTVDWNFVRSIKLGGAVDVPCECDGDDPRSCVLVRGPDALYAGFCSHRSIKLHDITTGKEVRTLSIEGQRVLGN